MKDGVRLYDPDLILPLHNILHAVKHYVRSLESMIELHQDHNARLVIQSSWHRPKGTHSQTYNQPTDQNEVRGFT